MLKSLDRLVCQGLATVFGGVAMTNIGTTSLFMLYQPEPPEMPENVKD